MRRQPLLFLLIPMVLGILLEEFFPTNIMYYAFFGSIFLLVFIVLNFLKGIYTPIKTGTLVLIFFCLGAFLHGLNSKANDYLILNSKETLVFKLDKKLNSNERNRRYEIIVEKEGRAIPMVLSVPKDQTELRFDAYYKGEAYVNRVASATHDFQFDYAKYLSRKQIYYQAYAFSDLYKSNRLDSSWGERIKQWRWNLLHKLNDLEVTSVTREFVKGIILADRTEFSQEVVSDFNRTGLVHILAISGSHMVILFFTFFSVFKLVFRGHYRKQTIIFSLCLIWLFSIFIDYGSSVMRSCIMITIYYAYVLLERQASLLHSLALAALVLLAWDTHQLFDVGFQLSFAAVLGIYWLNQPILTCFPERWRMVNWSKFFLNIFSITLAAQIATLPFVLLYFHQFSTVSVLANLLVIPLAEVLIIAALFITVLVGFNLQISWLFKGYDVLVQWVLRLIHELAGWTSRENFVSFSFLELILAVVVVYFLRFVLKQANGWNIMRLSFSFLVLYMTGIILDFKAANSDEILEHKQYKSNALSIKKGRDVLFIIGENSNRAKTMEYLVKPYCSSRRISNYKILTLNQSQGKFVTLQNRTFEIN